MKKKYFIYRNVRDGRNGFRPLLASGPSVDVRSVVSFFARLPQKVRASFTREAFSFRFYILAASRRRLLLLHVLFCTRLLGLAADLFRRLSGINDSSFVAVLIVRRRALESARMRADP